MTPRENGRRLPLSVAKSVVNHADVDTVARGLSTLSCKMRLMAKAEYARRHRDLFDRITADVPSLHDIMRRFGAVLGGSAVVQMVCPIFDDVNDFDFFTPLQGVEDLVEHFVSVDGYTRCSVKTYDGTYNGCTKGDLRYLSCIAQQVTLRRGDQRVDVIGVGAGDDWDAALAAIASSWTTLLFNYASADWVVVGYPTLTLHGRGLIQWDRVYHRTFPVFDGGRLRELEKYQSRGFQFQTHADDWDQDEFGEMRSCGRSWVCPLMPRSFSDGGCLRIAVTGGVDSVALVDWTFGGVACPLVCDHPEGERADSEIHVEWCACK